MKIKKSTIISNGKKVQTLDNPLNSWVRNIETGKLVRNDGKAKTAKPSK